MLVSIFKSFNLSKIITEKTTKIFRLFSSSVVITVHSIGHQTRNQKLMAASFIYKADYNNLVCTQLVFMFPYNSPLLISQQLQWISLEKNEMLYGTIYTNYFICFIQFNSQNHIITKEETESQCIRAFCPLSCS